MGIEQKNGGLVLDKIKALHIASFNGNIGDNANHNGFRKRLEETLNRKITYTNLEMREFYQSWNLRDFNSSEFIDLCNNHDLVIFGGGNFFELKWDYSSTGTTINLNEDTIDKINTPILFHGVGCDVAKGASQNAIDKFEKFLDKVTNDSNILMSVRNDGSYETIQSLYGNKYDQSIIPVPDGAFFFETENYDFPELSSDYKSIGINVVNDMKDIRFNAEDQEAISYDEFIKTFSSQVNNFLKENNEYQVIFYPHIYSDLLSIYEIISKLDDPVRRRRAVVAPLLTGEGSEKYIFGLYRHCEFIMGMRFHTNVCSIAQNIPTIALSSYKKIDDLYGEISLTNRIVKVNETGFEKELEKLMNQTKKNIPEISKEYQKVNETIYDQSLSFYDTVAKWFEV